MNNLKTIKELADELGVSKQAIQYYVTNKLTNKPLRNEKGIIFLNIEEQAFISNLVKKSDKETNKEIKLLVSKNQVADFKKELTNISKLVDQQQQLQLKTQLMLEKTQEENQQLRALKETSIKIDRFHEGQYFIKYHDSINYTRALEQRVKLLAWVLISFVFLSVLGLGLWWFL